MCEICENAFTTFWKLTVHKRIHTGEKLFNCYFCEKAFTSSSLLTKHKRNHTGERPFKCEFLNLVNERSENPFQCCLCEKAFSTSPGLTIHKKVTLEKKHSLVDCVKNHLVHLQI